VCHPGDGLIEELGGPEPALAINSALVARKDFTSGNQSFNNGTLFLDYANNFVGVNSTFPTAPLDVTGDAVISGSISSGQSIFGDAYRWNTTKTLEYAVGPSEFQAEIPAFMGNSGHTIQLFNLPALSQLMIFAPVHLPPNAFITKLKCYYQDNTAAGNFTGGFGSLISQAPTDVVGTNRMSYTNFATTGAVPTMQIAQAQMPPTSFASGTRLFLSVALKATAQTVQLQFFGCGVEYTLDGPG
jgi:hypothetical protein